MERLTRVDGFDQPNPTVADLRQPIRGIGGLDPRGTLSLK
jgi:hypothetical protein